MSCECLRLRSEIEHLRSSFSSLEKNNAVQIEVIRTKTKEQYEKILETQKDGHVALQQINEQEIRKLKEIINMKNGEIEKLLAANSRYRSQLNTDQEANQLKISAVRRESTDTFNQISKYQEEIAKLKWDFQQREELINQQHKFRIEEIQQYYSNLLKSNGKEKQELLIKIDQLTGSLEEVKNQKNNEISSMQRENDIISTKLRDEIQKLKQQLAEEIKRNQAEKENLQQTVLKKDEATKQELKINNLQIEFSRNKHFEQLYNQVSQQYNLALQEIYRLNQELSCQQATIKEYKQMLLKLESTSQINNNQFSEMLENQKKRLEQSHSYEIENLKSSYQTQILLLQQQQEVQLNNGRQFSQFSEKQKYVRKSIADV